MTPIKILWIILEILLIEILLVIQREIYQRKVDLKIPWLEWVMFKIKILFDKMILFHKVIKLIRIWMTIEILKLSNKMKVNREVQK